MIDKWSFSLERQTPPTLDIVARNLEMLTSKGGLNVVKIKCMKSKLRLRL